MISAANRLLQLSGDNKVLPFPFQLKINLRKTNFHFLRIFTKIKII